MADAHDPAALAAALKRDCTRLRASIREFENAPPEDTEEACERHLREARRLKEDISCVAARLEESRRGVEDLPEPDRTRALENLAAAREALQDVATAYGRITADFADVLTSIRGRLQDLRHGDRVLRTYGRTARR